MAYNLITCNLKGIFLLLYEPLQYHEFQRQRVPKIIFILTSNICSSRENVKCINLSVIFPSNQLKTINIVHPKNCKTLALTLS